MQSFLFRHSSSNDPEFTDIEFTVYGTETFGQQKKEDVRKVQF